MCLWLTDNHCQSLCIKLLYNCNSSFPGQYSSFIGVYIFQGWQLWWDITMHSQANMSSVVELLVLHTSGLIALVASVQQRNVHSLRAFVVGYVVPYVPLQRVPCCQHVVVPKGSRTPLHEPSVSPTRLSIILTAALNLSFFCRQLQATVIRFTCTCL